MIIHNSGELERLLASTERSPQAIFPVGNFHTAWAENLDFYKPVHNQPSSGLI